MGRESFRSSVCNGGVNNAASAFQIGKESAEKQSVMRLFM
jgi:hypothetical protein